MSSTLGYRRTLIRTTSCVLAALLLGSCGSPEKRAQRYYENGMKLYSEHKNAKAAIELRNAVRLKGDLTEAWKKLAEIDEADRNWSGLAADMKALVELDPNDVSARLKFGKLLFLAGSTDEALGVADAGVALDDTNPDLHALKAAIFLKLKNRPEAIREGQAALALEPNNPDALAVLAADKLSSGDLQGARSLLQNSVVAQAVDRENNIGLQLIRIKLFGTMDDSTSSEAALKKLIELNPQEASFRKLLVNFFVEQNRPDDAERELRDMVAAHPSDSDAALDLVRFLYTVRKSSAAARQELATLIGAGGDVFAYRMALAELEFAEGRADESRKLLEQLAGRDNPPEKIRAAKVALAKVYLSGNNLEMADKLASEVLRDEPQNVSALTTRALLRLQLGQLDGAIVDLSDALNAEPRSTDLKLLLSQAYERSGLIELADKELSEAVRTSNMDAKIGLRYAAFLQRRGGLGRANELLVGLRKQWPDDSSVLSALATVKLVRQDWSGAQEAAEALRRMPGVSDGSPDQMLGAALLGQNKYDEAIAVLQAAYKTDPSPQAMSALVGAFFKANRKAQAVSFTESVLAESPDNATAMTLLGAMQRANGSIEQAHQSFLAAVSAQPNDPVGYSALAELYLSQQNYDEAIKVVRTGIERRPDAMSLRLILAAAYERIADFKSAISEYQSILKHEPGNLIATNNLASLLLDHHTDTAELQKAQSLAGALQNSDIPQFKDTLAWALYHQGDFRRAVSLSEEAAVALPDQAQFRYHLGMSYIATGQMNKASEQLKKAIELASDEPLADQARAAMKKAGL